MPALILKSSKSASSIVTSAAPVVGCRTAKPSKAPLGWKVLCRTRGFVACLRELATWGDASCEAGAIAVRWALWQSKLGLASKLLREAVGKSEVDDSDYVELQRALPALLGTWLGFEHFGEMLATKAALGSPATRRPF